MAVADKVVVELEARTSQYDARVRASADQFGRNMDRIGDSAQLAERRVRAAGAGISVGLAGAAGSIAGTLGAGAVIKLADNYTLLQNRLKAAGLEGEALARVEDQLFEAANRNGIAVDAVAQLYQRASQSRKSLGASESELIQLTNGLTAALRVQGVSAEQASGPLLQLGQALGGGTVRAEELNSLLEGTPIILQAAANGSAKFGGDMAKLASAIRDGKVSSQEFFQALLTGLPALEAAAGRLPLTVGQALQVLNNELGRYIGQSDQSLSASQRLAQGIEGIATNLDKIIPAITILIGLIGTRYVLALTASAGATIANTVATISYQAALVGLEARQLGVTRATVLAGAATRGFGAILAANPIGIVILAVAALAAGLVYLNSKFSEGSIVQRELEASVSNTEKALGEYEQAQIDASTATGEAKKNAIEHANALRVEAVEAVRSATALRERTAALAAERAELAQKAASEATRFRPREEGEAIGALAFAGGAQQQAERARAQAEQARKDAEAATRRLARIDGAGRAPSVVVPVSTGSGRPSGGQSRNQSGPTAEELAAMREQLRLQNDLDIARAGGQEKAIAAAQRLLDIYNLTEQFERAQIANARELATQQVDRVAELEGFGRATEKVNEEYERFAGQYAQAVENTSKETERRLNFELALARIAGDETSIKKLERELALIQRINEYGPGRADQAGQDQELLNNAEDYATAREKFRESFSGAFQDLINGDVGSLFDKLADRFKSRLADGLADILFNALNGAGKGGGGSNIFGTILGGIGAAFGIPGLGGAGGAGKIPSVPITPTRLSLPSVSRGMPTMASAPPSIIQLVVKKGEAFEADVQAVAGPIAIQTASISYQQAVKDAPRSAQRRARNSFG